MSKKDEALKLALEALETCDVVDYEQDFDHEKVDEAITALREALAEQPAQLPVGEVGEIDIDEDGQAFAWLALHKNVDIGDKLYTSPPPQRKPLTLGQKQRLWSSVGDKPTLKDRVNAYGLAIEAAHGIKENT